MKWKMEKLSNITSHISSGSTPRGGASTYLENGPVLFIRSQNVHMNYLKLDDVAFISNDVHKNMKRSQVNADDVLLNITGASIGRVCGFTASDIPANVNQHVCIIRPIKKKLSTKYLTLYLSSPSFQAHIDNLQHGGTRQALTFKQIGDFEVPLPPLDIQKTIATVLNKADQLRKKRKESIEKLDQLIQSLFLDMFGDPVLNKNQWGIYPFSKYITSIISGKSAGGDERPLKTGEMGVLKISAVTSGVFKPNEYKVVKKDKIPDTLIHPRKNDLLFSRANTREMVGATCLVDGDYTNLFLPDKLWNIILKEERLSKWYMKFLLSHDGFRENLRKVATGTSGSMLNISKEKLKKLQIPVPPIDMQNQFAERIQSIEKQKQQAQASLKKLEELFNCLMQKAFKGELVA